MFQNLIHTAASTEIELLDARCDLVGMAAWPDFTDGIPTEVSVASSTGEGFDL